ncbi:MAG: hypothetical protein Q4A56_00540 [Porphyromonadaceae bacterium]|nr:hypothetical protein [Porphyromonadaceae bacterium]
MQKYKGKALAIMIFESAMAVFYLLAGVGLLLWHKAETIIQNQPIRIVIAVLFLLYGIFRVYRAIKKLV